MRKVSEEVKKSENFFKTQTSKSALTQENYFSIKTPNISPAQKKNLRFIIGISLLSFIWPPLLFITIPVLLIWSVRNKEKIKEFKANIQKQIEVDKTKEKTDRFGVK